MFQITHLYSYLYIFYPPISICIFFTHLPNAPPSTYPRRPSACPIFTLLGFDAIAIAAAKQEDNLKWIFSYIVLRCCLIIITNLEKYRCYKKFKSSGMCCFEKVAKDFDFILLTKMYRYKKVSLNLHQKIGVVHQILERVKWRGSLIKKPTE